MSEDQDSRVDALLDRISLWASTVQAPVIGPPDTEYEQGYVKGYRSGFGEAMLLAQEMVEAERTKWFE